MKTLLALALLLTISGISQAASSRRFENLGDDDRKHVKALYRDLLDSHEKKDFAKMSTDAQGILALLDDYNDTKAYDAIARRGLEQTKLDKDPETPKRKERALRDLAVLEIKGQGLVAKAKSDPDARVELYKTMTELQALDPASTYPAEWRKKLHEE